MIKLKALLENSTSTYDYGCAMLYFDVPGWSKFTGLISKDDVYTEEGDKTYGIEDEPHVTLLYGLHKEVTVKDVKSVTDKITYGQCLLHNVSTFNAKDYDVLKFDVSYVVRGGAFLHKTNTGLKKFPYTTSFPTYHPHMTIAYIKSGMGKKYVDKFKDIKFTSTPTKIMFSEANGTKHSIKISIDKK